jgi:hypothetical protein
MDGEVDRNVEDLKAEAENQYHLSFEQRVDAVTFGASIYTTRLMNIPQMGDVFFGRLYHEQ